MKNIKELRDSLLENYEQAKDGKMDLKTCKELANTAGKIINTVRVELDYIAFCGVKKNIAFLRTGEESRKQLTE